MAWYNPTTWFKPKPAPTPQAGVRSYTESEVARIGETNIPKGSVIYSDTAPLSQISSGRGVRTSGGGGGTSRGGVSTASPQAGDIPITTPPTSAPIVPTPTAKTLQPATSQALQPSVHTYDPNVKVTPYGQTYTQAIVGGFGAMGRNIKQFFTGRTHKWTPVLAGFEYAGTLKRDLPTITPHFGTMIEGQGAFQTYGELQKEIDVERGIEIIKVRGSAEQQMQDIQKEFQSKIDIGTLTLEEAESQYAFKVAPIQEQFSLDVGKIYEEGRSDVSGLYERTGVGVQKFAPMVLDITGYTVAGTVAGPLGVAGYGTFRGAQLAAKGRDKDIYRYDEGALYPGTFKLSPESKAAGMHFGMAAFGAISAPSKIGAEITALRISEGMKAKAISMPRIISREGDDVFRVMTRTGRRTPTFEADTKTTFDIFRTGDKTFQIGTGTGKTTTRVLDFMKQMQGEYPWRTATKSFTIMGRGGEAMLINAPEGVRAFTGKVLVAGADEGFTGVRFGGVSRPIGGKDWLGVGGEVKAVRLYSEAGRRTALVSPKDFVFGKDISFVDVGSGKTWGWTGGGKKSSKQFFEQLYKPATVLDISGQATATAQKVSSGVSFQPPQLSFIPSTTGVVGTKLISEQTGVTETKLISEQRGAMIQIPSLLSAQIPSQKDKQGFFISSGGRSIMEQIGRQRQEFITTPITLQKLGTKQIQRQRLLRPQFIPTITPSGFGISPPPPIPFKIPIIPWLPSGRLGMARGGRMLPAKQIFRYTPSYAGFTWGIKAPQIPKAPFGKFTGLEIRPIVPGGIKFKI